MIGLVYLFKTFLASNIEHIRRFKADNDAKNRAFDRLSKGNNPHCTYYNWKGYEKDLLTNQQVITQREAGEIVIKDLKGNIIRNLTQEEITKKVADNKEQIIKQYQENQLRSLWFNKYIGQNRLSHVCDNFTGQTAIYIHCKTGKQCVCSNEFPITDKRTNHFKGDLIKVAKEILLWSEEKNCLRNYLNLPDSIILDLQTGKIIDINKKNNNWREVFENVKYFKDNKKEIKKYTIEETQRVIDEYNRRIDTKEIVPCLTGWEKLFV